MGDRGGWRIPGSYERWLLVAVGTAFVAWSAVLLPSGCQGSARTARTPDLPPSPLDGRRPVRTASVPATPGTEAARATERPKPPALRPELPQTEPVIRVRVESRRGRPFTLGQAGESLQVRGRADAQPVSARGPVSVAYEDGWRVVEASGSSGARPLALQAGDTVFIEAGGGMACEGARYPGSARVVARSDIGPDAADLVFDVPMETYLPGVLAKELLRGWSREAFRAQAVAARSYAMCEHAWWQGRRHFDVVAGQGSQAWIGLTNDRMSNEAVRDTRGEYLVFDGRVVPAYYSSCCGGVPATATDAIREGSWMDIAPLIVDGKEDARRSGCCEKAPTARWKVTLGAAELARRLDAWADEQGRKDLGGLTGVKSMVVAESNPAGRPVLFRIADANGRKVLWESEDLRYAVNAGASGSKDTLKSGFVSPSVASGRVTFDGRGHGHGSGMCQFGAESMAKAGREHRDILRRYYPGATVQSAPAAAQASMPASEGR